MAGITLENGREIVFNLNAITVREYRILRESTSQEETDPPFAKACGITVKELEEVGTMDFFRLRRAFWLYAVNPLDDPN
ncbi:MAG: hypothetical protein E6Q97_03055 [Desulfurellales bacterium]|nr:MAG: hypothetical protein E6Q97_03055 [Desulfurellales bacterium]